MKYAYIVLSIGAVLLILQGSALLWFGQPLISGSGEVNLWTGIVKGSENSQHISDWYTFSHIIHGFIFYGILSLLFPRMHIAYRLLIALSVEIAWEITENTPWLIGKYREHTLAFGYTGDSVINSVCDSLAAVVGFLIAWRIPILLTIGIALALELFVGVMIRDNLTLNILNFIHRFEFISAWQSGAPIR